MRTQISCRRIEAGEEAAVSELISAVFNEYVAPIFPQEGIDEFMPYIAPAAIAGQLEENCFALVATAGAEIVGVIEVRDNGDICFFFVDGRFQRQGIGRTLLQRALELCGSSDAELSSLTVNASPNSRMAYGAMGFEPTDDEWCTNGIRFVPMVLHV